jgi:hypothetical protein
VHLLGAVAGVEISCDTLVLKDGSPGYGRGVRRKEGATGGEGERLHISHDTLVDAMPVVAARHTIGAERRSMGRFDQASADSVEQGEMSREDDR